jgi:hypothetical protein
MGMDDLLEGADGGRGDLDLAHQGADEEGAPVEGGEDLEGANAGCGVATSPGG